MPQSRWAATPVSTSPCTRRVIEIQGHHTVEDTAIVLGRSARPGTGGQAGIRRFGDAFIPMDETLAHAAVDVSGRPYFVPGGEPGYMVEFTIAGSSTPYHAVINRHVFESLTFNARIALRAPPSTAAIPPHHRRSPVHKAVARAVRQAVQ